MAIEDVVGRLREIAQRKEKKDKEKEEGDEQDDTEFKVNTILSFSSFFTFFPFHLLSFSKNSIFFSFRKLKKGHSLSSFLKQRVSFLKVSLSNERMISKRKKEKIENLRKKGRKTSRYLFSNNLYFIPSFSFRWNLVKQKKKNLLGSLAMFSNVWPFSFLALSSFFLCSQGV
jgi:hypothetical protein